MTAMFNGKKLNANKLDEQFDEAGFENGFENGFEKMISGKIHNDNDKDRFTATELAALRSDLMQGGMIDSYEAAELLQVFLMGRGYGVSPKAALDAASRVEMAGCALPVLQHELENLAMVM
jgi:hypothetical protein